MPLLLFLLLSPAASQPAERVSAVAEARIVVLRPHRAEQQSWAPVKNRNQREILVKQGEAAPIRVRVTEFE